MNAEATRVVKRNPLLFLFVIKKPQLQRPTAGEEERKQSDKMFVPLLCDCLMEGRSSNQPATGRNSCAEHIKYQSNSLHHKAMGVICRHTETQRM